MVLVVFEGSAVRYPEKEGHKDQRSWEIQLCIPPEADSNRIRKRQSFLETQSYTAQHTAAAGLVKF